MRRIEQVRASVVEHRSPARGRRRNSKPKKAHGCFGENCSCHAYRRLHNDGLDDVRKNMTSNDAYVSCPESLRCFDIFAFACCQYLSTDKARVSDPASERQCQNKIEDARTAKSNESNCEQNSGKRQKRIHHHYVDEAIDAPSVVASDGSDYQAQKKRRNHNATANQHRDAGTINKAGKNVAAKFVRTKPMGKRWCRKPGG